MRIAQRERMQVVAQGHVLDAMLHKTPLLVIVDAGSIAVDGQIVSGPGVHVPAERRRIGYVAQGGGTNAGGVDDALAGVRAAVSAGAA